MLGSRCAVSKMDLVSPPLVWLWVYPFVLPWCVGGVLVGMVVSCPGYCGIVQGVPGCVVFFVASSYLSRHLSS